MAIDDNDIYAMNYLAFLYSSIDRNYDLAKKYYLMAIDNNNSRSMCNLAIFYEKKDKNYELAKKYYIMAINNGRLDVIQKLKNITSPLERYVLYTKNNIKFNETITRDINIYKNKVNKFMIICKCPVCLEEKDSIQLECTHYVCTECYVKLHNTKCPICRL